MDPFKKYEPGSYQSIEETLVNLTNKNMNADLVNLARITSAIFKLKSRMQDLIKKLEEGPDVLSGSWQYKNNRLYNSMTIFGTDQAYFKRHLVPFGEYVPFEGF